MKDQPVIARTDLSIRISRYSSGCYVYHNNLVSTTMQPLLHRRATLRSQPFQSKASTCTALLCRASASEPARQSRHSQEGHERSSILRTGLVGVAGALALRTTDAVAGETTLQAPEPGKVAMRTLAGSELAIGFYPKFIYNSSGGGGLARASTSSTPGRTNLEFDPQGVSIPDVTSQSTTFLGVPLLPYLRIAIKPTKLEGFVDQNTGEVELYFDAEFNFNAGQIYKAPPLFVKTRLTTEAVQSKHHSRQGSRMDSNGLSSLVGVADIAPTGDPLLDNFLQLPTDVLAVMQSQFAFSA